MIRGRSSTSSSDARRVTGLRAAPWAALLALVVIVLFEYGFVWKNRHQIWDANYTLLEKKRRLLTGDTPPDSIAVLGTSRFYHLNPQAIAGLLPPGALVHNYAWGWAKLETYEAMLRGMVAAGRAPKAVVVDGLPELFAYNPDTLEGTGIERYAETTPFTSALSTALRVHDWPTAWQLVSYHLTPPSTRYGDRVVRALRHLRARHTLPPLPEDYDKLVTTWQKQGWFQFAPPQHVASMADFRDLQIATGPWVVRENEKYTRIYEHFVAYAASQGIRVIMLPVANNPLAYDVFQSVGILARYDRWLADLQHKYPNFSAARPHAFTWGQEVMGDAGHLNAAGVARHMPMALEQLREALNDEVTTLTK